MWPTRKKRRETDSAVAADFISSAAVLSFLTMRAEISSGRFTLSRLERLLRTKSALRACSAQPYHCFASSSVVIDFAQQPSTTFSQSEERRLRTRVVLSLGSANVVKSKRCKEDSKRECLRKEKKNVRRESIYNRSIISRRRRRRRRRRTAQQQQQNSPARGCMRTSAVPTRPAWSCLKTVL